MQPESARAELTAAAATLGLMLELTQQDALLAHLALLEKWNRVYNLTALRDPEDMLRQHLIDSLAVVAPLARALQGKSNARLLDVGSGAGLPGVVLAIAMPHLQVICVDTVGKKASFVQQAGAELGLANLRSVHTRVEQLDPASCDVITSRAFSSLARFVELTHQHLAPKGVWMAMKGKVPSEEIAAIAGDQEVFHVEPVVVPALEAERCLVWIRPRQATLGLPSG